MNTNYKETREPKYLINRDFTFDESTHTYTLLCGTTVLSTTTLLGKQHLAPDFEKVMATSAKNKDNVLKARDKGTFIHSILETYINAIINNGKGDKFTLVGDKEANFILKTLKEICIKNNIHPKAMTLNSELPLIAKDITPYAGTIDLIIRDTKTDKSFIIDFKTGYPQKEKEQWQLNLYKNLYEHNNLGAVEKMYTINSKTEELTEIPLIERTEIEKLLTCEKEGRIYADEKLKENTNALPSSFFENEKQLVEIQKELKMLEENNPIVKEYLTLKEKEKEQKDSMKEQWTLPYGKSIITPFNTITYSVSKTLDTAKVKKEYKEVYENCIKETAKFIITPIKPEKNNEKNKGDER